jgi:DNA-binding IclR family transcriptional regulator
MTHPCRKLVLTPEDKAIISFVEKTNKENGEVSLEEIAQHLDWPLPKLKRRLKGLSREKYINYSAARGVVWAITKS